MCKNFYLDHCNYIYRSGWRDVLEVRLGQVPHEGAGKDIHLSFHHNLHLDEFAWEEVNTYSLASDGLWDNINMDEVLDTQA